MAVMEWTGVVNTTAKKYLKGASDNTIRSRLLLAMMQRRGRISYRHSGYELRFQIEYLQPPVRSYGDGGIIDYARQDRWRQLVLPWRGYYTSDAMTEKERLMNRSTEQLIDRYAQITPGLEKAIRDAFGKEIYIDGYASGNLDRLIGLESFMGVDSYTPVDDDVVMQPDDNYGGKSTTLQSEGGSWSSDVLSTARPILESSFVYDWPDGNGDSRFDWLSPKLVRWNSHIWTGGSAEDWETNCERCIRRTILWQTITGGQEGRPDLFLTTGHLLYDFKNNFAGSTRVVIPHKEAEDLGFGDTLNLDGVAVSAEFDCPVNTAYGLNLNQMEMMCLYNQLFYPMGPEWDPRTMSYLFCVAFFGNMKFNPKAFSKLFPYATA